MYLFIDMFNIISTYVVSLKKTMHLSLCDHVMNIYYINGNYINVYYNNIYCIYIYISNYMCIYIYNNSLYSTKA